MGTSPEWSVPVFQVADQVTAMPLAQVIDPTVITSKARRSRSRSPVFRMPDGSLGVCVWHTRDWRVFELEHWRDTFRSWHRADTLRGLTSAARGLLRAARRRRARPLTFEIGLVDCFTPWAELTLARINEMRADAATKFGFPLPALSSLRLPAEMLDRPPEYSRAIAEAAHAEWRGRDQSFPAQLAAGEPLHADDCQSQIAESDCNYDALNEGACTCGAESGKG